MRHVTANPHRLRQLGYATAFTGATLAAIGTLVRDCGDDKSWTYALDAVGWMLAVAGAVAEARVSAIFATFQPRPTRRRATLLCSAGIGAALGTCVLLSTLDPVGASVVVRVVAASLLVGGVWAALGGGLSLAVTVGARYAADRLANLEDS